MKIKKNVFFIIPFLIILLSSIRGFLVYHFHFTPNIVYGINSLLLITLGIYSHIKYVANISISDPFLNFKKTIRLNSIFLSFYAVLYILFLGINQFAILYTFLIFPVIFTLINFQKSHLKLLINLIVLITALGVFIFYKLSINGGFQAVEEATLLLRPVDLDYARIGENILPAGYQANNHDAANILIMGVVYYLTNFFTERKIYFKIYNFMCFLTVIILTLTTGSATSIALMLLFVLIIFSMNNKILFIIFLIASVSFVFVFSDLLYFFEKFRADQNSLDDNGIYNSLNLVSILKSFPFILFGFGYLAKAPLIDSEIAFIKILVSYGIIPFANLLFLLIMPYWYYIRLKNKINVFNINNFNSKRVTIVQKKVLNNLLLTSFPIYLGALSLIHYGSIFRITSIGIFMIFYALFFKEYLLSLKKLQTL